MKMPLNPNPLEARQPGSGVAPTQGAQGATGVGATAGDRRDLDISPPDPEVTEAKPRRRFTAAYKLSVIDQADQCSEPGQIGALLRREGLYSSQLTNWRKQRSNYPLSEPLRGAPHSRMATAAAALTW